MLHIVVYPDVNNLDVKYIMMIKKINISMNKNIIPIIGLIGMISGIGNIITPPSLSKPNPKNRSVPIVINIIAIIQIAGIRKNLLKGSDTGLI